MQNTLIFSFLVLGVVIDSIFIFFTAKKILLSVYSTKWPTTDGVINEMKESASVEVDGDRYFTYSCRYSYSVEGVKYCSSVLNVGEGGINAERLQILLWLFPAGKEVIVYYDPKNPENAVLEVGIDHSLKFMIFFQLILLIFLLFFAYYTYNSEYKIPIEVGDGFAQLLP